MYMGKYSQAFDSYYQEGISTKGNVIAYINNYIVKVFLYFLKEIVYYAILSLMIVWLDL